MQHLGVDSSKGVVETTISGLLQWAVGAAEPGGLPSMGSHRVGHDWSDLAAAAAQWAVDPAASGSISEAEPSFAQVSMTVLGMTPEFCKDGLAIYWRIRLIGEKIKSLLCDLAS